MSLIETSILAPIGLLDVVASVTDGRPTFRDTVENLHQLVFEMVTSDGFSLWRHSLMKISSRLSVDDPSRDRTAAVVFDQEFALLKWSGSLD